MTTANEYRILLRDLLEATRVESPNSFSWFGRRLPPLAARIARALTPEIARDYLVSALTQTLYLNAYCPGSVMSERPDRAPPQAPQGRTPFIETLSAANSGTGFRDGGWTVRAIENGAVMLERDGLTFRAPEADCRTTNGSIAPGVEVTVWAPKEKLRISPGFYMALSDVEFRPGPGERLVRLYWNITEPGAVTLVQKITTALNGAGLPFLFKTADSPHRYNRCDAAVLYVARSALPAVFPFLVGIHKEVFSLLEAKTPAFTKRLGFGLGLAEDPVGEESFGQHRCRLVAEAIAEAYERGLRSSEARQEVAIARFAADGLNIDHPFLNRGSVDDYDFPGFRNRSRLERTRSVALSSRPSARDLMGVAISIGQHLCREAIWWGDRCNWLGAIGKDPKVSRTPGLSHGALNPNVYDGSSGVALFLAELGRLTGNKEVTRTALGGATQAVLAFDDPGPREHRRGLYAGRVGVAYAAARIGRLLRAPELEKAGRQLALRTVRDSAIRAEYDLLQGHAGEIVGWLSLSRHFGDERFRRAAVRVGEHLLTTAEVEKGTLSWGGIPKWPNLVGFAHGAAGVGYGLLELFQATGDVRFREAALSAFAYERGWFNATEQNWPDLTGSPGKKDARTAAHSYLSHWCHGAPGIAVSRLRAFSQLGLEELKTEATIALETTERSIGSWLGTGGGNFSLCHGLAGNADVLLMANDILGPSRHRTELIRRVAGTGVEKHAVTETPWPCGAGEPGTQIPSLFLGLAGIGYFYLRLAGKGVPSLLSFGSSADEVTI